MEFASEQVYVGDKMEKAEINSDELNGSFEDSDDDDQDPFSMFDESNQIFQDYLDEYQNDEMKLDSISEIVDDPKENLQNSIPSSPAAKLGSLALEEVVASPGTKIKIELEKEKEEKEEEKDVEMKP